MAEGERGGEWEVRAGFKFKRSALGTTQVFPDKGGKKRAPEK